MSQLLGLPRSHEVTLWFLLIFALIAPWFYPAKGEVREFYYSILAVGLVIRILVVYFKL
jgi:uncharacterized protein YhhL (DUF1145 family)